ncbi:MAG TPA: DUF167 family protein [Acetobacteraceae bacterium]|nr:DUF167 family protein [Acetobacteraceae bacterium]
MFWRIVGDAVAVAVAVKVQPRARCPGLQVPKLHASTPPENSPAPDAERLVIAVREPAQDGRANRAACAALAAAAGVPPSWVDVTAGAASRHKTLRVSGDAAAIATRLAAL